MPKQKIVPPPLPVMITPPPLPPTRVEENNELRSFNLDSIEGIQSVAIPKYQPVKGISSPINNIEYILQRKATEHKKNGRMDLAIECLRKSNEIFPYSNFLWSKKDFLRIVEFLNEAGRFAEAHTEQDKIENFFQMNDLFIQSFNNVLHNCRMLGTDLVEMHDNDFHACGECAKYSCRIFSITGKDKRFPAFPNFLKSGLPEHKYCAISFYPYSFNFGQPTWNYRGDLISWSNRPFIDERNRDQKSAFAQFVVDNEQEQIDRDNYNFLRERFPDICPKSFGAFRRIKNIKSTKYLSLCEVTKNSSIDLEKQPDLSIFAL